MHDSVAKTAVVSSVMTLLIVAGLVYGFKAELVAWLQAEVVEPSVTGDSSVIVTRDELVTNTIAKVNPAVVSVVVTKDVPVYERYYEEYNPFGFGGFVVPRVRENGTQEREVGGGSGFIVASEGLVVTNRHVVADEDARYSVITNNGDSYEATVLARDQVLDIAVLQLEGLSDNASLPALTFGNSEELQLGQSVIAIGNALAEFKNSVSVGVVSGLSRSVVAGNGLGMSEQLDEVIQTDAAINLGNSGGPLLTLTGEVIGMNVAASIGAENIGFALPSNVVKQVVDSVKEHGRIIRPFLGVRHQTLTPQLAQELDLPLTHGALVVPGPTENQPAVLPGSPAGEAGIKAGDIIVAIDEVSLEDTTLAQALRARSVGDTVTIKVQRDDEELTLSATLVEAES